MSVKSYLRRQKTRIALTVVAVAAVFSFSFVQDSFFEVSKNLDIFTTFFRDVNLYYVDSIQPGELMKKGMDGMLKSLDPYTIFIPESDIEDYRMTHISAEYGGIGALVMQRDGAIVISEIYQGFPAHTAGLQVGDCICSTCDLRRRGQAQHAAKPRKVKEAPEPSMSETTAGRTFTPQDSGAPIECGCSYCVQDRRAKREFR